MPRYKTNTRFWYIGKRNKNNEMLGLLVAAMLIGGGAWTSTSVQARSLLVTLVVLIICLTFTVALAFMAYQGYRQQQRLRMLSIAQVDAMSGRQFEHYVAELLKAVGYSNVTVTKASGDYGADIIARKDKEKWAIQTKCFAKSVGNKAVNEVVGSKNYYHCDRTMVVTNSTFTPNAKVAAHANNTTLVDRDKLAEWIISFQRSQAASAH